MANGILSSLKGSTLRKSSLKTSSALKTPPKTDGVNSTKITEQRLPKLSYDELKALRDEVKRERRAKRFKELALYAILAMGFILGLFLYL